MNGDEEFLQQVLEGIADSEVISIFLPLLRRALVVDTRHNEGTGPLVKVMPQLPSMEHRITSIERLRPQLGKVRSILGVPWLKSVRALEEEGVVKCIADRLVEAGMDRTSAQAVLAAAFNQLWKLESISYAKMIRGEGFKTIWAAR